MRLLSHHNPTSKQKAIERHSLRAILLTPHPTQIRVRVLRVGGAKARSCDEDDVGLGADGSVRCEDGGVEVFAGVVPSCATAGPLEDDGEVGGDGGDVDYLANSSD